MQKIYINLPKYRLQIDLNLIKRRKDRAFEPLIPSIKRVKRKYRKGSLLGRYLRHITAHKNSKRLLHSGMAIIAAGTVLVPQTTIQASDYLASSGTVIEAGTSLVTQKGVQAPVQKVRINQNFSYFHPAIDFGGPVGEPVKPIRKGNVTFAGYTKDGYGNNVIVDHGQGGQSLYAHLSKIEVVIGQEVGLETIIGYVGKSGRTTGPHLHLETRVEGTNINPLTVIR